MANDAAGNTAIPDQDHQRAVRAGAADALLPAGGAGAVQAPADPVRDRGQQFCGVAVAALDSGVAQL
ncbi:hypothetical protein D3C86_2182820 [compost metagenome]